MVQQTKSSSQKSKATSENGASKKQQITMSHQKKDGADLHKTGSGIPKKDIRSPNGTPSGFRTDTAISGNRATGQRELQRWQPDQDLNSQTFGLTLESASTGQRWDQFKANEDQFGVKSNYDENFYTTAIDRSAPGYAAKLAAADRLAREIENSSAANSHIREERTMNHSGEDDGVQDEEDKYSGVLSDFPPLSSGSQANRYVAPARRPPAGQATVRGAPIDPAIITSSLAKPKMPTEQTKPAAVTTLAAVNPIPKVQLPTPQISTEAKPASTPTPKPTLSNSSTNASRTTSPSARAVQGSNATGAPNATATVERDLASAFKSFASQQRTTVENMRTTKAKADKESKLSDLKKFAETFKLNSPVPTDLVPIIAKDPAKQREIQERSQRNAEQQERDKQAKLVAGESAITSSAADTEIKHAVPAPSPGASSNTAAQARSSNRGAGGQQGQYNNQAYRGNFVPQGQQIPPLGRGTNQGPGFLGARLRAIEQNSQGRFNGPATLHETRAPPSGAPFSGADSNFSRRSSGATSMAKLNPSTQEFRPNAFAASFNPAANPSSTSSPRTGSNAGQAPTSAATPVGSLVRKRLNAAAKPFVKSDYNILEKVSKDSTPQGKEKAWAANGNFPPAFDTAPTWRQAKGTELEGDPINLTYTEMLSRSHLPALSPSQTHSMPPVAHQHQLPFHLQQGAQSHGPRNTARQPSMHSQNHMHGPNGQFNGDDHRMIPSLSAQSFASPRLQQANMGYPSPMGQPAQIIYQQNGMQFPMGGPQTPQMGYRSYSGGPQFVGQQPSQVGGQVMMPGPGTNGFMGPGMSPGPQMIYPGTHFIQGPPPMMPGANGYPSPGRGGAPVMMQQGSQQGHQPGYGMSPGLQYGQPVFAQGPQGQMSNMRGYPQGQSQFNTSPQMNHQFNHQQQQQQHRGLSGSFNKNYQHQQGQHSAPPQQAPTGPQPRPDGAEESK